MSLGLWVFNDWLVALGGAVLVGETFDVSFAVYAQFTAFGSGSLEESFPLAGR